MRKATVTQNLKDLLAQQTAIEGGTLFAILDAARAAYVPVKLSQLESGWISLYRGEPEETLAEVAPYLVKLEQDSEILEWIFDNGWGDSWGIFMTSSASLEDLRKHFRHFLLVQDEDGNELYFRFYDPRVLRVYLPTCTVEEARQFFGPVASFLVESEDAGELLQFSLSPIGVLSETIPLAGQDKPSEPFMLRE